ncbi:sigma-70 family RNA polymerase sigma factor [Sphaerisporangium sp. B11E5]|uniref:RNA polymerase sigma factor n=1 Tax=Sphaerisporangium sp. B11E5 TaxID=3153563 RepID=UPI00325D1981
MTGRPHVVAPRRWRDRYTCCARHLDRGAFLVTCVPTVLGRRSVPAPAAAVVEVSASGARWCGRGGGPGDDATPRPLRDVEPAGPAAADRPGSPARPRRGPGSPAGNDCSRHRWNDVRVRRPDREETIVALPPDDVVVAALRAGDEAMFAALLDTWSRGMLRVARSYVSTADSAEEVVQDAWLAVIGSIDGFEGRSSLKTWIFRIVVNTAKKRGVRESRTVPWSTAFDHDAAPLDGQARADPGPPGPWPTPEGEALAAEVRAEIAAAVAGLPTRQRDVMILRDMEGCTSDEVCEILDLTPANQRVLLHRARTAVRGRLADYFATVKRSE